MAEIYDKLGELLNNAIKKGKIRDENINEEQKNNSINLENDAKLHKYTENMQFPNVITSAFKTLDIAYPFTKEELNKAYHKQLIKYHPDTAKVKTTIQNTKIVEKLRQKQIISIQKAYKTIKEYFNFDKYTE